MNGNPSGPASDRSDESGFTLIEALVAIIILVFGLIAVSNLLLVAATSNSVANQATAAATAASETLEDLKRMEYGTLVATTPATRTDNIPGVGVITTTWTRTQLNGQLQLITVTSEGTGVLSRRRSRARYTTLRGCTAISQGCPTP
jgi:Tfp pilus assembly protein PilV